MALKKALPRSVVGCVLVAGLTTGFISADHSAGVGKKPVGEPRLILLIVVDQMRADYLERFRPQFSGGLKMLLERGAVFTNAHHDHAMTVTAAGHAVLLTGLYPSSSGIIGNSWFDRQQKRSVEAVEDTECRQFDNPRRGVSPRRLNGTTLVDWLLAKNARSEVVSVSRKDRSAVLMVGKRAKHVYWYNPDNGGFTSSTYYQEQLPRWVARFNARQMLRPYVGARWSLLLGRQEAYRASREDDFPNEANISGFGRVFPHQLPRSLQQMQHLIVSTPWMDEYTLQFAKESLKRLKLGRDDAPDLLAVGLSSTDSIGHAFGPYSKEVEDQILRVDRMLGDFFKFLDEKVGLDRTLIVLSADHGVAPIPEYAVRLGKRARRVGLRGSVRTLLDRLKARFGQSPWILSLQANVLYFNYDALWRRGISLADLNRETIDYIRELEPVARVCTREQLMSRDPPADVIERRLRHSFHPRRSGDVFVILKPYYSPGAGHSVGAGHGTPYDYDTHVPIIMMGRGAKPGRYNQQVATVDLAPTLAAMLGVEPLNPVDGRARKEILSRK